MTDRQTEKATFLSQSGWGDAVVTPLAGDASFRRYDRLAHPKLGDAVLMDAPPDKGEDCRPFLAVNDWLEQAGFRVAHTHAHDLNHGFMILADLGDNLVAHHLTNEPGDERLLYTAAIDTLVALHQTEVSINLPHDYKLPPYDHKELLREVMLLPDWYWPAVKGDTCPAQIASDYQSMWEEALSPLWPVQQPTIVLRDYHAENLFWLPDGARQQDKVGIIDHQDALLGHPAYDLISLLEDARRLISPDLRADMMDHYCTDRAAIDPEFDDQSFRQHAQLLAAQRNSKIIGIFARLEQRDGKQNYLSKTPLVWSYLNDDLKAPGLESLRDWFCTHFPDKVTG